MFCKFCGSELPENANFCTTCGKINEDDTAATPAQNPAPNYQQPAQPYQQPAQPYQQPTQPYQPYQQPAQSYQQPAQPYQPYQQPYQSYQQPAQPYQQPAYAPFPDANNPYQLEKNDLAGSILKFSILGLAFANTFFLSVLGLIFSIIARKRLSEYIEKFHETSGKATVGKILSLIGLIMGIVLTAIFALYVFVMFIIIVSGGF